MTLTFELRPNKVKAKHHEKYLGQRLFCSKVIAKTHIHRHMPDRLLYLDH